MIVIAAVIGIVLLIYFVWKEDKKSEEAWRDLAERTGLSLQPRIFMARKILAGTYRGRSIKLNTVTRGDYVDIQTGYNHPGDTYTRMAVSVDNPAGNIINLLEGGQFFSRVFGAKSVQIGHKSFDRRFTIQSRPENFAASVLSSAELRKRIMLTHLKPKILRLGGRELYLERKFFNVRGSKASFFSLFDLLCDVADEVEKTS
ncbi:MAG: hypothetical protein KAS36_17050 [Anaerolineales bacterium]|nr:hypothetical protein [Anaerolineales bacterium]